MEDYNGQLSLMITYVFIQWPPSLSFAACNPISEFRCANDRMCVSVDFLCDLEDDCGDGSDEQNCRKFENRSNRHQCKLLIF